MKVSSMLQTILAASLIAGAISVVSGDPARAAAPAEMQPAIAAYNSRNYTDAISKLQNLSPAARNHPFAHYYLGLSYQATGQRENAKREYKWNYTNSKDADIRYKSWAALTALERSKTTTSAAGAQTTGDGRNVSVSTQKDPTYTAQWGSAAALDKKAESLDGSKYEVTTVTPTACGRRR